ncbi:zinc-ribbon domain and TM2 domain-containing protein [Haloarcula amylovorans]|uniref:zinc-ribbon domain and TM2 domain-containing protein n=1 Tax=Haloarcula amylovorans TaxID=2562280 RepID=UPI001076088D|nr:TM2 domain-containing protein [Halomicroarcula amylolytica]
MSPRDDDRDESSETDDSTRGEDETLDASDEETTEYDADATEADSAEGEPSPAGEKYCTSCGAPIDAGARYCSECGAAQDDAGGGATAGSSASGEKDRVTAGIFAILLGSFGVHHFYLGNIKFGVLYLCFCWTGLPGIAGLVEGILYLTKTDEEFQREYVDRY